MAKADLVPTEYNLLDEYHSFAELEAACTDVAAELNARPHSVTRRAPAEMLDDERPHLHPIPDAPYTAAFGESRTVAGRPPSAFRGARYSVPDRLCGSAVWVRAAAGEVVIIVGRGLRCQRGGPPRPRGPGSGLDQRRPLPARAQRRPPRGPRADQDVRSGVLGPRAREPRSTWSKRPRSVPGASRRRMAEAVTLGPLHGADVVDRALGMAAMAGRFAEGDLESIIVHASGATRCQRFRQPEHSLAAGTAMWSALGANDGGGRGGPSDEGLPRR